MAQRSTTSLDLPPVLAQLLGPMTPPVTQSPAAAAPTFSPATAEAQQSFNPAMSGLSSGMTQMGSFVPSYQTGGMVGAGGMPDMAGVVPAGVGVQPQAPATPMSSKQVEMQIQEFMNRNPQQVAQIQQVIQVGLQSGELTLEDLDMAEQLAMTALQNPEMYPYVRNFAIQQGFAGEQDLSPQYDEGLIIAVLIAARVAKGMQQGAAAPTGQSPMPQGAMGGEPQNFAMGGMVTPNSNGSGGGKVVGPGTGTSDSVPIRVSTGEYVIPAHVVKMKGKEFFDSMLEKYKDIK